MKDNELKANAKRRFKRTTNSGHNHPIYPNLLDQDFIASRPNEKWSVDISCIWTREDLAVVMVLCAAHCQLVCQQ